MGIAIALLLSFVSPVADLPGLGGAVVPVAVVVAGLVLVFQRDPFRRGIGAGLLIALAVALLLIGACAYMLRDL